MHKLAESTPPINLEETGRLRGFECLLLCRVFAWSRNFQFWPHNRLGGISIGMTLSGNRNHLLAFNFHHPYISPLPN
jgi:hypothetical protein